MKRNLAPVRPDHFVGAERFAAEAAKDQRSLAAQHFGLDPGRQRFDLGPIALRHLSQVEEERLSAREIGMGAFVEGAPLVGQASRDEAPKTRERLKVHEVLEPPHGQIGGLLPVRQVPDRRQVVGDDLHLPMREAGDREFRLDSRARDSSHGEPMRGEAPPRRGRKQQAQDDAGEWTGSRGIRVPLRMVPATRGSDFRLRQNRASITVARPCRTFTGFQPRSGAGREYKRLRRCQSGALAQDR